MFGRAHPKVEVLARVPAEDLPWRYEGVLVLVSKGLGTLSWRTVKAEGATKRALMLRDTPLLFAQSDEYWCPTCEKLLALGWGRDQVDEETLALVRNASSDMETSVDVLVDQISPVLRLLQESVYLVSRVPHSPTNGAGEPFWRLSTELRPLEASKDWYFADLGLFELAQGYPAFLLPTQSPEQCNREQVDEYRNLAAQGQPLGGLAFWVDGFLSALLDGHPRATAALLENTPITCLTIMSPTGVEVGDKEKLVRLWDAVTARSPNKKFLLRRIAEALEAQEQDAAEAAVAVQEETEAAEPQAETAAGEPKLTKLSVEELETLYTEVVGRDTGSSDRRYLIWKIREARKGRIPVGPVRRRHADGEAPDMKVLPLRMDAEVVARLDEARERLGLKTRMDLFRRSLADYLTAAGEHEVAQLFTEQA